MSGIDLKEIRYKLAELPALERRLSALRSSLEDAKAQTEELLKKYEKESLDVEQIQNDSFSSAILKILRKYDEKLELEQYQEIEAKHRYDEAMAIQNKLTADEKELRERVSQLRYERRKYEDELENRRRTIETQGTIAKEYRKLEEEIQYLVSQSTETKEAINALSRVSSIAKTAADSLSSAESWATYDMWTRGGILSHAAKYSHIDKSEEYFSLLHAEIKVLKQEIADIDELSVQGLTEITSGQRAMDYWFDNIFTDMSVRSQIRDNKESINRLISDVRKLEGILKSKESELNRKIAKNQQLMEELLVSIN